MSKPKEKFAAPLKPVLPTEIRTIDQAKQFLVLLKKHSWLYNPDDDALKIQFPEENSPNVRERRQLNKLMDEVCGLWLPNVFSPYEYFVELQAGKSWDQQITYQFSKWIMSG